MTTSTDNALDLQMDLLSWTETSVGVRFTRSVGRDILPVEMQLPGRTLRWEDIGEALHAKVLYTADTFAVAEEIVDVLEYASSTIPDYELHFTDMPTDTGFVVLDRPMVIKDSFGKPLVVKALGWTPTVEGIGLGSVVFITSHDIDVEKTSNGIVMLLWTDPSDPRDHLHESWARDDLYNDQQYQDIKPPQGLWSMYGGLWKFGVVPDDDVTKILMAFFRFVQEPWVDPRMVTPSRHARRRALRKKVEPKVHVVRLRRKEGGSHGADTVPGGEGMEWSCRWLVRGHWRNQWYPSIKAHRPKWIPEHIKGPDDKPLVIHDTVFQVDR